MLPAGTLNISASAFFWKSKVPAENNVVFRMKILRFMSGFMVYG
jgi:hypothetical protein